MFSFLSKEGKKKLKESRLNWMKNIVANDVYKMCLRYRQLKLLSFAFVQHLSISSVFLQKGLIWRKGPSMTNRSTAHTNPAFLLPCYLRRTSCSLFQWSLSSLCQALPLSASRSHYSTSQNRCPFGMSEILLSHSQEPATKEKIQIKQDNF